VFYLEQGDEADVFFLLEGASLWCSGAWDFGRPSDVAPREWEWWDHTNQDVSRRVDNLGFINPPYKWEGFLGLADASEELWALSQKQSAEISQIAAEAQTAAEASKAAD